MSKKLDEMTLEELWRLFPIILTEHRDCWATWYAEEATNIAEILPKTAKIYHIGSTAVKGIWAKPTVDILVEVNGKEEILKAADALKTKGFVVMSKSDKRISLNKGYTENGFAERVFHLHLRLTGDNNEIYFRDYLNAHPDTAKEYERLKLSLWKEFEFNRDGYTEAKSEFINRITELAKKN